jgi:hypothetical protein
MLHPMISISAKLGDDVRTKGKGAYRTCSKCGHKWYYYHDNNTGYRGCGCITCRQAKAKEETEVRNEN